VEAVGLCGPMLAGWGGRGQGFLKFRLCHQSRRVFGMVDDVGQQGLFDAGGHGALSQGDPGTLASSPAHVLRIRCPD
jgi:hypothetical protein